MDSTPAQERRRGRPPRITPSQQETREAMIRCGTELLTEKAFLSTGLDEMLKHAGVAKGSFYHYFRSKEAFGLEVIDNYDAYFCRKLDRLLLDESYTPLQRIANFMQEGMRGMQRYAFRRGCLIGNLAQELASLNETFRQRLQQVFRRWKERIAVCLMTARAAGNLAQETDCDTLATFFWMGWEGAVLQAKLNQSNTPLAVFATQFFSLLGHPETAPMAPESPTISKDSSHV
jgi:TetR/AcrR family transcriptional repressor of nem operon